MLSKEILEEYIRVLAYPKFKLTHQEIHVIVNEYLLPFVTIVRPHPIPPPALRDMKDTPFIICALSGKADYLVTGDRDLLDYQSHLAIISVKEFLEQLS